MHASVRELKATTANHIFHRAAMRVSHLISKRARHISLKADIHHFCTNLFLRLNTALMAIKGHWKSCCLRAEQMMKCGKGRSFGDAAVHPGKALHFLQNGLHFMCKMLKCHRHRSGILGLNVRSGQRGEEGGLILNHLRNICKSFPGQQKNENPSDSVRQTSSAVTAALHQLPLPSIHSWFHLRKLTLNIVLDGTERGTGDSDITCCAARRAAL